MKSHCATESSGGSSATNISIRTLSKTIAVTYVGLGLFGAIFLITGLYDLDRAVVLRLPSLLIPCVVFLTVGLGFIYVMLGLHQRCGWARRAAVCFWLLCLIWTASAIVRNGFHP